MKSRKYSKFALMFSVSAAILLSPSFRAPRTFGAAGQSGLAPARITEAISNQNLVTLGGNTPLLARPEFDRGAAPDSLPLDRMLLLLKRSPRQDEALAKLLTAQQDKSSPFYHRWLTPAQFGEQYGPNPSDLGKITDWLQSQGFRVSGVSAGRTVIEFSGTAGLVRGAFHTPIHQFAVNGKKYWSNAGDPRIPRALAPVVAGIVSLNNFPLHPLYRRAGFFTRSKKTGRVQPLYTINCPQGYVCTPSTFYGLAPADFATIYNVLPLWNAGIDGTGQTIAIVSNSNINVQDVANFRSVFGLAPNPVNVILDGPDPGLIPGNETEADLDVEWAGAVARNSTIDLVVSENTEATFGIYLSALYIVDHNLAPVMSVSYGACEAQLGADNNAFVSTLAQQAAAEGITVVVASGDSGSAGCDYGNESTAQYGLAVSGLASTPYNVAVGGTDFLGPSSYFNTTNDSTTGLSAKSYVPEITWNDSCASSGSLSACPDSSPGGALDVIAGGGGPSNCSSLSGTWPNTTCSGGYSKPAWQTGNGVPQDGVRDIPDVSLFAGTGRNGAFYIICTSDSTGFTGTGTASCSPNLSTYDFAAVGGTSASAPTFAAIMALVNQKTGQRQGNANFVLYPLAAAAAANHGYCTAGSSAVGNTSCVFYNVVSGEDSTGAQITPGNNSVPCVGYSSPDCGSHTGDYSILVQPNVTPPAPAWTANDGYNMATGLGSVNAANLVNQWSSVSFSSSATTLSLSTTPATNPITLTHGQPVNFDVQVNSGSGTPTGDVSLQGGSNGKTPIDTATLSNGEASGTTVFLPGGSYGVTAHYPGDGTFGRSDSTPPVQVTVNPESSATQLALITYDPYSGAITNPNASSVTYGSYYFLRADVTNSSANLCAPQAALPQYPCPTGNVTMTDNGAALIGGTAALNSQAYADDFDINLPGGTHTLAASYSGDSSYKSGSGSEVITISPAPTMTISPTAPYLVLVGSPVTLKSNVYVNRSINSYRLGSLAVPTGTATFDADGTPMTGTLATIPTPATQYNPPSLEFDFTTSFATSGMRNVTVTYTGDSNYAGSTSPGVGIDAQYLATVALSASPQIVDAGTNVTLTALVDTSNKSPALSGYVNFPEAGFYGVPVSPTTDVNGNSAAEATATFAPGASTSVVATYGSDDNYAATSSPNVPVFVFPAGTGSDFQLSEDAIAPPNIANPGQSGTVAIRVVPSPGTDISVSLTCSLPATMAEATCSFSPSSVSLVDQNLSTAKLTVTTTGPHTTGMLLYRPDPFGPASGMFLLALLMLFLLAVFTTRRKLLPLTVLGVALLALSLSCGGGGNGGGGGGGGTLDPGTAVGGYDIGVTGTATINGASVTHTIDVLFLVGGAQ